MKRTDDFLADLETQLGAATAGHLRRRRRVPMRVLRPLAVTAVTAAAATAFVLAAATGGPDPERAAEPPVAASGGPFALQIAHRGICASDPGSADVPGISVLDRPGGTARADAPVHVVARADVQPCVFDGTSGPGACTVVRLGVRRTACWTAGEIEAGRAAAGLGDGFVVALVPDRVREVTFVIGDERDTYAVTDNVVVANLEGAKEGVHMEMLVSAESSESCGSGLIEDAPLPGELLVALPVLEGPATQLPDPIIDRLAKAGSGRMWLDEVRELPREEVGGRMFVVPVADARFAECGDPMVSAPRAFEGPGACLVAAAGDDPRSILCVDLDDFLAESTLDLGDEELAFGFLPHWAVAAERGGRRLANLGGLYAGRVPPGENQTGYIRERGPRHPVHVIGPKAELARELIEAGHTPDTSVTAQVTDGGPTRVWYAPGMAESARRIAELVRAGEVVPMAWKEREIAGEDTDVLVLAGDDLRP